MLRTIFAPHLGTTVKMGRTAAPPGAQKLQLAKYATAAPFATPASADYAPKASAALNNTFLNERLGCCVVAAGYHILGVLTGNAGPTFTATSPQIISDYSAIGKYVPGDPSTDRGCNEQEAFNHWMTTGFADGSRLAGYTAVNAANPSEVKAALYLFENLIFGMTMPNSWIYPLPSKPGFVWDAAGPSDPNNGHCVMATGYNDKGVQIVSWGFAGTVTWKALAEYAIPSAGGEMYALLSPDQLIRAVQKAPNGIAWNDLVADFNSMGGSVSPDTTPQSLLGPPLPGAAATAQASSILGNPVVPYVVGGAAALGLLYWTFRDESGSRKV